MKHCYKKRIIPVLASAALALGLICLSGCGNISVQPEPTATPVAIVTLNGQEISVDTQELSYSGDIAELVNNAAQLQNLNTIHLEGSDLTAQEVAAVKAAFPAAEVSFSFQFNGIDCTEQTDSLDLSGLKSSDIPEAAEVIAVLPQLKTVSLVSDAQLALLSATEDNSTADSTELTDGNETVSSLTFADYEALYDVRPDVSYQFAFDVFGKTVTQDTYTLKYLKTSIGDDGLEKFQEYLTYLPNLSYLSFDRCDTTCEACAALREAFPDKKIEWRIYFGRFSCMTDAEKIWAIGSLTDEDMDQLKYCTEMKYCDLGHNSITKIDFVRYWPKLEVLIVACTTVDDITPLEDCPNLEYLEVTVSQVSDISVLAKCKNLKHLEISQLFSLTDISPLFDLDLERLHAMADFAVPDEQKEEFVQLHPDCDVNFDATVDPFNQSNWRYEGGYDGGGFVPRYQLLREQIGYDDPYGTTLLYEWMDEDQ